MVSVTRFSLLASLAVTGVASMGHGQIVFTEADTNLAALTAPPDSVPLYPVVTAGDLLNGLTNSAAAGNFTQELATGVAALTDGASPATITRTQVANPTGFVPTGFATAGNTGGTTVTYTLAAPSTITSIVTLGGWQDNGRDQQSYTVSYSLNGSDFVPIGTTVFNPGGVPASTPDATMVTFTSTGATPLTNVVAIKFDFNATENGYSGYTELQAFGTATTPEPASLSALGLAGLGLLARRRRA